MASYKITVGHQEFHIEVGDITSSPVTVNVNGKPYSVQWTRAEREAPAPAPTRVAPTPRPAPEPAPEAKEVPAASAPSGGELVEIIAPMPGKILKVSVQPGDVVQTQQSLCTLEAMKMESAIQSTAAGTVVSVNVQPGATVQFGDVLVVVEKAK